MIFDHSELLFKTHKTRSYSTTILLKPKYDSYFNFHSYSSRDLVHLFRNEFKSFKSRIKLAERYLTQPNPEITRKRLSDIVLDPKNTDAQLIDS